MKQQMFGIAAAIGAASLLSLFTARRIEAQYASPVRVMNTASAPAIHSGIDDPGRVPYQSTQFTTQCSGLSVCSFIFGAVPSGHRLVITHLAGAFAYNGFPSEVDVTFGTNVQFGGFSPAVQTILTKPLSIFDRAAAGYVDGGTSVTLNAYANGTVFSTALGAAQNVTLMGYLVDCGAAPCSPIAN